MSNIIDHNALQEATELALQKAKEKGATQAEIGVSQTTGLSVSVRQSEVETLEHNHDKGLGVTVYFGQRKASASTSDLRAEAIVDTVSAACDIAKHTEQDEGVGLADAELMAKTDLDLSLYHPWSIDTEQAIDIAIECEQAGLAFDDAITNSEGSTVSSHKSLYLYANSHGFLGTKRSTRHSMVCTLIADDDQGMQRDYYYDMKRDVADLLSASFIGEQAAERTLQRRNARQVKTGHYPVVFLADVATSLFGKFISAISGGALYRESTFLLDHIDKKVFPDFVHVYEQPHLLKGLGSAVFDSDGVATTAKDIVNEGILRSYVLDAYSARKLGMNTTANAGGVHNLTIDSGDLDLAAMLKQIGTGVLVTETMGMGVNIVTGDYSQGAAGFWVEQGEIQYPIDEFTIASNLKDMFMGIQAIANDVELRGNTRTGSVWIDKMSVAS